MLKKISGLLIIALILTAVPAGAALALPQGEEQVIKQEVIMGYFDVWKGSEWQDTNNDGSPDKPGQTGKVTKPFSYSAADKLGDWQITRVEVTYPFTPDEYLAAGGRQYGPDGKPANMTWDRFRKDYLNYLPQNLSVQIAGQNLAAGKVTVQWGLDLPSDPLNNAFNIKDEKNRQFIGYQPQNFDNLIEGWRWYLPGIITWYGVPKEPEPPVNTSSEPFSIDGCFWDLPRQEGNAFYTYIIRAPRTLSPTTLYDIKEPINGRIRVYQVSGDVRGNIVENAFNTDIKDLTTDRAKELNVKYKLVLDQEVTFTKDNPVWVKKVNFSAPLKNQFMGLFVQTEGGVHNGISNGHGVSCSVARGDGDYYSPGSHTTSGDKGFTSWLPWELIKERYGLSPLHEK